MTTDTDAIRARVDKARIGPHVTCPASRHAAMIAEAMMRQQPYPMLDEERDYCGSSIGATVAALWEARAEIARLREALNLAAKRLDWASGLIANDAARDRAGPWGNDARAALAQKEGE